ncbi:peptidoglycan DD-metalloendopeptidase family protein [Streptomyces sp. XM83C]|jgi:murein DD-endopeptidase MepM/ murein hydrolase activator NlpD|uniref:M23 family metallopeptidase n=1 Tax=unclassified Streptomyces TaxID=2593676 RepID=UPI001FFA94AF|nr:M23 family metallopeptidase [Streptomyces sp. XM83C]MCK1822074.1 peptidoglycan DD-metalloendopeptidase family protein [Streptomyces sp. XM83C]
MPAKGKHRRPKAQRLTRTIAAAGTGGAALALPILGATGAHAATPQSAPDKAVRSAPVAATKKAAPQTGTTTGARVYTVKPGDYLSRIAVEQHVRGGWQKLYADNREAIGSDPSLIHPGLKLALGKKATHTTSGGASVKKSASSAPKTRTAPKAQPSEKSSAATTTAAQTAATGYTLPVSNPTVGTPYHLAGGMWSSGYHTGADFVVPTGTSVRAVAAGTVVSAGWGGAYGNQVVIRLNDGYYAQYAHLSQLSVSAGQSVAAGQQLGLSGATGNVTGPHLHFEIRTTPNYGSDVDPVAYLRSHGVSVG